MNISNYEPVSLFDDTMMDENIIQKLSSGNLNGLDDGYKNNLNFAKSAIRLNPNNYQHIDFSLKLNVEIAQYAVCLDPKIFKYLPERILQDQDFIFKIAAYTQNTEIINFAVKHHNYLNIKTDQLFLDSNDKAIKLGHPLTNTNLTFPENKFSPVLFVCIDSIYKNLDNLGICTFDKNIKLLKYSRFDNSGWSSLHQKIEINGNVIIEFENGMLKFLPADLIFLINKVNIALITR